MIHGRSNIHARNVCRVMARVSNGPKFRIAARLDPDFVELCPEMQRLPLDMAKKGKLMGCSTIFRHIMSRI